MMGLGWQELAIVLVIIMVIFGAGKLPEVARSLGQGVKEFKSEAASPIGSGEPASSATVAAQAASGEPRADLPRADTATEIPGG
jgi:sec-independent protein translocase protein TatA